MSRYKRATTWAGTLLEVVGLLLVAVGFGLWSLPLGLVAGGIALVVLAQGVGE